MILRCYVYFIIKTRSVKEKRKKINQEYKPTKIRQKLYIFLDITNIMLSILNSYSYLDIRYTQKNLCFFLITIQCFVSNFNLHQLYLLPYKCTIYMYFVNI